VYLSPGFCGGRMVWCANIPSALNTLRLSEKSERLDSPFITASRRRASAGANESRMRPKIKTVRQHIAWSYANLGRFRWASTISSRSNSSSTAKPALTLADLRARALCAQQRVAVFNSELAACKSERARCLPVRASYLRNV